MLSRVRSRWAPRVVLGVSGLCVALLAYAGSQLMLPASPVKPVGMTPVPTLAGSSSAWEANAQALVPSAATRTGPAPKMPSSEKQVFGAHVQQRALDPSRRMPQQVPLSRKVDSGFDHSDLRRNVLKRPSLTSRSKAMAAAAVASCNTSQFASLSGSALVSAVKAADTACINALFGITGSTAYGTFREAQMVTIANALKTSATYYNGTNADSTLQLVLYLRAGYFVQFYDSSVGSYGASLKTAIRGALDAFAVNANFGLVNDVHGEILAEYVTLLDSSGENARYLYVVKRLLDNHGSAHNAYYWMKAALNNAYTVLFRGHDQADFRTLVQSDSSIVETLYAFANNHFDMLGGSDDYLVANAGRELGRFLQYTGTLKSVTQVRAKSLLDRSAVTGPTARLWVGVGEMIDYHDKANCSYYNLCDFTARVDAAALPIRYTCSATLRIRAQSMTTTELANTCAIVAGEESYFHQQIGSNRTPVANDYNSALEMVVFNSSDDYGTYAGTLYGINTNNGGMYLEGNPADSGNQARFIAYEAEWLRPTFEIWNLTHEYIHYLDGRFDMYGDFSAAMTQKTVWWVEGFAEYMSYSYRNLAYTAAQNEAALGTYALSTVFQNDYNSGTTRVYRWGYLAVRYMFENRRSDVSTILGYFRPGNYAGYASFMNSIATRDDAAFRAWLPCVASPGSCSAANQPPTARFSVATTGLTATFTDSSSDPDGSIVARAWSFGDGTSSTATNPSRTYASPGTYAVQLTVTDDKGARHSVTQSVTVSLPECTGADVRQLGRNCNRSNLAATQGNYVYLYLYVPAGTSTLTITTAGGTGNADLYVNTLGNWATMTAHNYRSTNAGNGEAITVSYPPTGYVYISLHAASGFSGVRVSTQY